MKDFEIFIVALFVAVAGLNVLARRLSVPYPIPLVLGGLALGLVPGIPDVQLDPDVVLLVFLPPLLYSAAFFADLPSLRADMRAIAMTSVGLVLATAVAVAVIGHEAIGLTWPMAFALGAIVSPTDPIAATTILRRLGAPRRLINVLEGESLVNDATALVAYRVALAVAVGGSFSAVDAGLEFVKTAAGGIAVGLVVGWIVVEIRRRLDDPLTEVTISLLTAYAAFVPADHLGVSGVLAVVTAGVFIGWRAPQIVSAQTRLQTYDVWEILTFLLNATLFILVGLQLPFIVDGLDGQSVADALGDAAMVCAAVIAMRFLWSFTTPYLVRLLDRRPQQRARRMSAQARVISSWSGMRGSVSLAAALAIPLTTDAGTPVPDRSLILFITFVVILVTLVGQGLTLPALISVLGVQEDGVEEQEEIRARLVASRAALSRLDELAEEDWVRTDTVERARGMYEFRQRRFRVRAGKLDLEEDIEARSQAYQRMLREVFGAQRAALVELRNSGTISSDVMRRVERELDLEESRLDAP